jgi:hypothetical protein
MTAALRVMTLSRSSVVPQTCKKLALRWQSTTTELKLDRFVPQSKELDCKELNKLQELLAASDRLVVLTGAGVSTESGIPGKLTIA